MTEGEEAEEPPAFIEDGQYVICSRCRCRRPASYFAGPLGRRCKRCRHYKKQALVLPPPPPKRRGRPRKDAAAAIAEGIAAEKAAQSFSKQELNPTVNLAARIKTILRKKMDPEELAERLVALARSADERIASASLETLMALQGVVVPKKPEEQSEQRFFVMSASLTPKVEPELLEPVPATALNGATAPVTQTNKAHKVA